MLLLAVFAWPALASAKDLPPDARAMLTEANPKERQAIVNVLKRLYPGSAEETFTADLHSGCRSRQGAIVAYVFQPH